MRVVFAGTPAFSVPTLERLVASDGVEVVGVYTQPDRPAGRGKQPRASAVKQFAESAGLSLYQPSSLKTPEAADTLHALSPDLLVVVAYGLILPRKILDIPRRGCVNIHASLLPRWRGAAPIQRAIEAGDSQTGVCLMQMEEGLDTGAVLARDVVPIGPADTSGSLHDTLATRGADLLATHLDAIAAGSLAAVPQDEARVTHAAKIDKTEARLDWRLPAKALERRIRAFLPWPVAVSRLQGTDLRIFKAGLSTVATNAPAGEILSAGAAGVDVATGDGALTLKVLQKPGKKPLPVAELLNGMHIEPGMRFESVGP